MKLLRIIASMNPSHGGPCQGIRNSIPELELLGVRNEVLCLDAPDEPFIGGDTFPIHAIGPTWSGWNYNSKLIPWLQNHLHRFDAVIVHGLWLYHSYAVSKVIRDLKRKARRQSIERSKIPKLYIMPHGMLDPYFQRAPDRKLKAIRNWIYYKCIEGKVINRADGILFTCEEELQLARIPFEPYAPKKEINVGYGIAAPPANTPSLQDAFLERCPGLKARPFILFLSRLHKKKGVELLIKAYAELVRSKVAINRTVSGSGPEVQFNDKHIDIPALVIAGPGLESQYGRELQKLVTAHPELEKSIFFPGMLVRDAKWGAFYGCEAFILSSHQENFGIAVVEALACCKPVLISRQVNIWREIESGGGGIVADDTLKGTVELLSKWLLKTAKEKSEMSIRARHCYERNFAIKPVAQKLLNELKYP